MSPDLPLAARYARATAVGWQLFLGGWVAAGAALAVTGLLRERQGLAGEPFLVSGGALIVIFSLVLMRARRRFGDPTPVITISAEAYHDRRLGDPIPWAEVRSLSRHKPGQRIFLMLGTDEPGRWLTAAGLLSRPMQKVNPAMGFAAVGSRLDGLDVPQERLAAAAEAAFAASR